MQSRKATRVGRQLEDITHEELEEAWVHMGLGEKGQRLLSHLLAYARGDFTARHHAKAHKRVEADVSQCLLELYACPHPEAQRWLDKRWQTIGTTDVDRVLRAALARYKAEEGQPVPLVMLSSLAGVAIATLRNYGAKGQLEISDGMVNARSVRRWLAIPQVRS